MPPAANGRHRQTRWALPVATLILLSVTLGLPQSYEQGTASALGAASVSAGGTHTCATLAGGVVCWGLNNEGQLGDGTRTDRTTPVSVIGMDMAVTSVSAGLRHTCALTVAGGVKCWGENGSGQLGDGTTTSRTTPVYVDGFAATRPPSRPAAGMRARRSPEAG